MNPSRIVHPLLSCLLLSALSAAAQVPNPGSEGKLQLQWLKQYSDARRQAETEHKPLLIDITTDWCGWSKKMDREAFANLAVQKELRSFVLIRLNPEASDENQKIAESFGVDGYPTLVVANSRGEEIGQGGYMEAKEMLEFLRRYPPLFKGNPLGYKAVQLAPADPLLKAISKIPAPGLRPTTVGSFVVLDQSSIVLQADGTAKMLARTATLVADPQKGDLPEATGYYVSSRQKLRLKTVRILDTKGAGREVDLKLTKDEHAYSNENVYWDARKVSVELPRLREGQILDVTEERELQPVMPGAYSFRWFTAPKILLSSDLTITFPATLNLQKRSVRCSTEVTESRNADGTLTWRLQTSNAKPYEPALFPPAPYELWEGYDFYTPCTADAIARWFSGLCQGRDELPALVRQRVAALKRANTNQTALLEGLFHWVTKDIRYVSVAFGAASHQPHTVADTLGNLYGDCKDQSFLLQALCHEAGLPASLLLVDATGEGFHEDRPSVQQFDHCIVEAIADGKPYYLDPAAGPTQLGRFPQAYAGTRALKISGHSGQPITLPAYRPLMDQEITQTTIKLNPDGSATVTESAQFLGEKAGEMKTRMKGADPEKVRKSLEASYKRAGRKLLDFYMTPTNALDEAYETRMVYTVPRFGSMTAGGLALKLGGQANEDWLGALNLPRSQSFRFPATDGSKTLFAVELPAGASLQGRPEDLTIETPFMKATRKIQFTSNRLSATETSRLLEAHLPATDNGKVYEAFRRLAEHRDFTYIVTLPVTPSAASEPQPSAPSPSTSQTSSSGAAPRGLNLNGISGLPPHRLAIINGKTLAEGESASLSIEGRRLNIHCLSIVTAPPRSLSRGRAARRSSS
jgi:transglutaminase-like putative cysteine protease/thioredoxin-related protein